MSTAAPSKLAERVLALTIASAAACGPDPATVAGALSCAASAVARADHADLFASLDERSRHALSSVYFARKRAAEVIRADYPRDQQASALAELGDAVDVGSAVDLFRRRCDTRCVAGFASQLGAPKSTREEGPLVTVETVRGTTVQLHRGGDGNYGLVWETAALTRERTRSAAELDLIEKNAAQYRRQRTLKE